MHLHASMQKSLLLIIPLHLTTSLCPFLPALIFFVSFHVWRSTLLFRRSQLCQNVSYWIHLESRCIRPIFSSRSILYVFSVVMLETIERLPSTKDILMNIALIIVQLWMRVGKIHLSSLVGYWCSMKNSILASLIALKSCSSSVAHYGKLYAR